ncbi:MAG TPA: methylmalonyl-CoA epimerase [Gaiellales bacterium]
MHPRAIHHIGHAVADLPGAVDAYVRLFGAEVEHREVVPGQGVEAVTLLVGQGRIELLWPLAADTPVGRFLESRGPGMHHVAFLVDDIRASLRAAAAEGAELIDAEPRAGLFGLEVAFIHPGSVAGVLVEYVQY